MCASLARRLSAPARARPPFQHPRSLATRRPTKAAACGKRPPGRDGLATRAAWRRLSECGAATATKTARKRPQGRAATRSGRVVATMRPVRRRATRRTMSSTMRAVHPLVTPQGAAGAVAAAGAPGRLPQRARRGARGRRRGSRPGQRRRLPCCRSSASPRRQTRPSTRWNGRLRTRRRRPLPCRAMSPKRPPCELKAQAPHQKLQPPLSRCTWLCSTRPIQRAAARPPPPPTPPPPPLPTRHWRWLHCARCKWTTAAAAPRTSPARAQRCTPCASTERWTRSTTRLGRSESSSAGAHRARARVSQCGTHPRCAPGVGLLAGHVPGGRDRRGGLLGWRLCR